MFISIIIPFYNEAVRLPKSLNRVLEYLNSKNFDFELILVNDGSEDSTVEMIKDFLNDKRIGLISHDKNLGKGAAVRTGVLASKGKIILFLDSDLSTPIEEIEKFLPEIGKVDIVIGSRTLNKELIIKKQPLIRRFIKRFGNFLIKKFLKIPYNDTQCGFKMFKSDIGKKIFEKMKMNRWSFDYEFLYLAIKGNYTIKEIAVHWKDSKENSKFHSLVDPVRSFADIFRIWVKHR